MRLIDADKLLEAIANSGAVWETNDCIDVIEILTVKKIVDNAPTIEPTTVYEFKGCDNCELDRPKGEWEYNPEWNEYMCPFCLGGFPKEYNFCPNCGADMRGDV